MAAFSAGGWYLGGALEIRLRTFRVGVGNLHDPALGNIMSLDSEFRAVPNEIPTGLQIDAVICSHVIINSSKIPQRRITARLYIGTPFGCLGLSGAAARRSATCVPSFYEARKVIFFDQLGQLHYS